jgi:hypothetical protein
VNRLLQSGIDHAGESPYDEEVGFSITAPSRVDVNAAAIGCAYELPTRSMVGQLPLEQHIGVRIPGGQPNKINNLEIILKLQIQTLMLWFSEGEKSWRAQYTFPYIEQNSTDRTRTRS